MSIPIILGYDGLGAVAPLAEMFRRYGFERSIAIVDNAKNYALPVEAPVTLVECPGILDPKCLVSVLREHWDGKAPYICLQDYVSFSYLDSLKLLPPNEGWKYHVPRQGILNSRVKALARYRCGAFDPTAWQVLPHDGNAKRLGKLGRKPKWRAESSYFVKPICGMASEGVKPAATLQNAKVWARKIVNRQRAKLRASVAIALKIGGVGTVYPYRDVLVEEALHGDELTVDGFVTTSGLSCIIQHKTELEHGRFQGNGLIVSPPEYGRTLPATAPAMNCPAVQLDTQSVIEAFLAQVLAALELSDWVFHAEIKLTSAGPRLIELNPRPPGGLLWETAGLHLGMDLLEICVRCHLRIPTIHVRRGWVTGEYPIYARNKGIYRAIPGLKDVKQLPGAKVAAASLPKKVTDLDRENYLAFVRFHAPNHLELSRLVQRARKQSASPRQ